MKDEKPYEEGFIKTEECVICLEDETNDWVRLNCNHFFHKKCINLWLKDKSTCPLCVKNVYQYEKEEKDEKIINIQNVQDVQDVQDVQEDIQSDCLSNLKSYIKSSIKYILFFIFLTLISMFPFLLLPK